MADLSPPRRRHIGDDLSPPRRPSNNHDLSPLRTSHMEPSQMDLSPPRRSRGGEDLSPPRHGRRALDLSPPRMQRSHDTSGDQVTKDLSPPRRPTHSPSQALAHDVASLPGLQPRRTRWGNVMMSEPSTTSMPLSDFEPKKRTRESLANEHVGYQNTQSVSPPRKRRRSDSEDGERAKLSLNPQTTASDRPRTYDSALGGSGPTGLVSADYFTDINQEALRKRDESLDALASRSGGTTVFRDKSGKVLSEEDIAKRMDELKKKEIEKKADQRQMEWGTGLAQRMQRAEFERQLEEVRRVQLRNEEMDVAAEEELRSSARSLDPMAKMEKMWQERKEEKRKRKKEKELMKRLEKEEKRREEEDEELRRMEIEGTTEDYEALREKIEQKRRKRMEKERRRLTDDADKEDAYEDTLNGTQSHREGGESTSKYRSRPIYQGVPWSNRFGIRPGYRWDGVIRGIQWEDKLIARAALQQAKAQRDIRYRGLEM